jgi:uncharacterized membrane protein YraQ (UPF0718 family)
VQPLLPALTPPSARSLFRKGADFIAAMSFQFASTNLVLELGVILWVLMGWQFTLAEFVGGPIMIVLLVLLLRRAMTPARLAKAREQAERGIAGRMEGHAAMNMSLAGGSVLSRALSSRGFTAISHFYVMDWASVWVDIVGGLVIAGALAAWVPQSFWTGLFVSHDPVWSKVVGPLIGPAVAVISFVCSIGNAPLAAVLWNGGISFGGVIAFLFADLIVLPVLDIYRKYYGARVAALLFALFYVAMAGAGYIVELVSAPARMRLWCGSLPSRNGCSPLSRRKRRFRLCPTNAFLCCSRPGCRHCFARPIMSQQRTVPQRFTMRPVQRVSALAAPNRLRQPFVRLCHGNSIEHALRARERCYHRLGICRSSP